MNAKNGFLCEIGVCDEFVIYIQQNNCAANMTAAMMEKVVTAVRAATVGRLDSFFYR